MAEHYHAIVWIDHHEARIFHFNWEAHDRQVIHPDHPVRHIHHHAGSVDGKRAGEDHGFYEEVAAAIAGAGAFLVTGPANAKTELVKHIERSRPALHGRLAGVETVDHPSDGMLLDHARRVFRAFDHTQPQRA
jgi:hypothetical protein